MKFDKVAIIILIVSYVIVIILYPSLPDIIPLQWNLSGAVSKQAPKWSVFLLALLPTIIYLGMKSKYSRKK